MTRGILGGAQPDPDFGKPYRRDHQKIRLMMSGMTREELALVLERLMDTRPEETLDAILYATGEDQ